MATIEQTLAAGSAEEMKSTLAQAVSARSRLPVPTEVVFWAMVFQRDGTFAQQRKIEQSLHAMDQAIAQDQVDRANQHLSQLRQTLDEVKGNRTENSQLLRDRR